MPDFRTMYDKDYIGVWDLNGKEVTVTIASVTPGTVTGTGGKRAKKGLIRFDGKEKGFICNITNGKVIAGMYGNDYAQWVGKRITLYPSTTNGPAGDTVECVKVRPMIPQGKEAASG